MKLNQDGITHHELGEVREKLRDLASLTRKLKESGKVQPNQLLELAKRMQELGRVGDSLKVLRRLLTTQPRHLLGHFLAARAHELSGRLEPALEGFQLVAGWAPPWPTPHQRMALCYEKLGQQKQARESWEAYLARAGADHDRRRALASDYLKADLPALALKHLQWLDSSGTALAADQEARGIALEALGRTGEAAGAFELSRQLAKDPVRPGLRLAKIRFLRGEYARCGEACDAVLARKGNSSPALGLAANAALKLGDLDRAQANLSRLRELHPEDPEIRTRFAETLLATGDLKQAARELQPIVDRFPKHLRATLRLAETRRELGDIRRARDLYGRVLAKDPGQPLALLRVGQLALTENDASAAVIPLRRLILRSPENPTAHRLLGIALKRAERAKDARVHLERALELNPDDVEASLELGHVLRSQQALRAAKVAYERVLRLAPGTPEATRSSYELSHLAPRPVTKEPPRSRKVVPLRPERDLGQVAPTANWIRSA